MSTKPPSPIREFPVESLEKHAYASVSNIPTQESNDRNRLGYHVWRWLSSRQGTLEDAVNESGARISVSKHEAIDAIRDALKKQGINID